MVSLGFDVCDVCGVLSDGVGMGGDVGTVELDDGHGNVDVVDAIIVCDGAVGVWGVGFGEFVFEALWSCSCSLA